MALFLARFKTYVAGVTQITVADMHRLQDELIAINEWKDAEESSIPGIAATGPGVASHGSNKAVSTSGGQMYYPIVGLPAGVQITSIDITSHRVSGANHAVCTLREYIGSTDTESDHGNVTTTATGPPATDTIGPITKTLLADAGYYLNIQAGAGSIQAIALVTVHWKRI